MGALRSSEPERARVVLRRWLDSGDVFALFPDLDEGAGLVLSYQHVGQHSAADYGLCVRLSAPVAADQPDAAELLEELRAIGYAPVVVRRRPRRPR